MSRGIEDLYRYTREVGGLYGTEDFSVFLYSIVKMHRPARVLELGTGTGVSTFWIARALQENGGGSLLTIDDGSHWRGLREEPPLQAYGSRDHATQAAFIAAMAERLGLAGRFELLTAKLPPYPSFEPGVTIDMLFSDFRHDPAGILGLLQHFLPILSDTASVFIDSASTAFASYLLLERLVELFNAGQVPRELVKGLSPAKAAAVADAVRSRRFTLVHLTEARDRDQNSTAWLKIEPVDILPHPATRMR
jgi:hypothetical protein